MVRAVSAEVNPGNLPPLGSAQPDVINAEVIKAVQTQGDVLDAIHRPVKRFPFHPALRSGLLAPALASAIVTGIVTGSVQFDRPQLYAYSAAAAGGSEAIRRVKKVRTKRQVGERLIVQEGLAEHQEPLELFRHRGRIKKSNQLDLYWGAKLDPSKDEPGEVRSRLERVAHLAANSDIKTVVVPGEVLAFSNDTADFNPALVTTRHWLKSIGKRPFAKHIIPEEGEKKMGQHSTVLELTPEECLKLASMLEESAPGQSDIFMHAWEVLKASRKHHQFIRRYAGNVAELASAADPALRSRAAATMRSVMSQYLHDVTVMSSADQTSRLRVNLSGTIGHGKSGPSVRLQGTHQQHTNYGVEAYHATEANGLLQQLEISNADLALFFSDPGRLGNKKRGQVAEAVLLYELSGYELPFNPDNMEGLKARVASVDSAHQDASLQLAIVVHTGMAKQSQGNTLSQNQRRAAEAISLKPLLRHRVARVAGIFALAAFTVHSGGDIISYPANYLYQQQKDEYLDVLPDRIEEICEWVRQNSEPECDPESVLAEAEDNEKIPMAIYDHFDQTTGDAYNEAIMQVINFDDQVEGILSRLRMPGAEPYVGTFSDANSAARLDKARVAAATAAIDQASQSNVGNVALGKNQAVWQISGKGLDSTGYWAQSTYDHLTLSWSNQNSLSWSQYQGPLGEGEADRIQMAEERLKLIKPVEAERSEYLRVESVAPVFAYGEYGQDDSGMVTIPVLEGMVPVAARVKLGTVGSTGFRYHPASVVQREDGTFRLLFDAAVRQEEQADTTLRLEYWLHEASDTDLPFGPVQATKKVTITDVETPNANAQNVKKVIDAYVPGLPADPTQRSRALERHIATQFDYELAPFTKDELENIDPRYDFSSYKDLPSYAWQVMDGEDANCNTANTTLVADNMELNPVQGFMNSNNGNGEPEVLSSNESHLWAADAEGGRYDATPSSGLDEEEVNHFKEDYSQKDIEEQRTASEKAAERSRRIKLALKAAGVLTAAALLVAKRKKIAAVAQQIPQDVRNVAGARASRKLTRLASRKTARVSEALGLIEVAKYDPNRQYQPSSQHALTRHEISERLRINQPSSIGTKTLKQHIGGMTGTTQRQRKLAKKVVSLDARVKNMEPETIVRPSRRGQQSFTMPQLRK